MEEVWKDIEGFEGLYQVSNLGNVRSLGHDAWHKGRTLKQSFDGKGNYLFVGLHKDGKTKQKKCSPFGCGNLYSKPRQPTLRQPHQRSQDR